MLFDVTFEAVKPEFSTNKYGFGYCKFSLNWTLEKAAQLFRLKSVGYVRLGTGNKSYFEGRLEDIEIGTEIIVTAFGYYRAFTDLQVNDLWSTTDVSKFVPIPNNVNSTSNKPDSFNLKLDNGKVYIAQNKNASFTSNLFAQYAFINPIGAIRKLQVVSTILNLKNIAVASMATGIQDTDSSFGAATTVYFGIVTSVSGLRLPTVAYLPNLDAIAFYNQSRFGALYVGETGDMAVEYSNIRIGTSPSISGSRLYADEILRFTISGVNNLNTNQISTNFSSIQSPLYDLTDVWFTDQTGLDVVNTLLSYPDTSGRSYEFKVWEDQRVIFRPKTSPNTWYIDISEIQLNRTLDKYYNQVNTRTNNTLNKSVISLVTVAGYHNRQTVLTLNTSDLNIAATAGSTLLSDYARKPPQSEISASYVRDSNGSYQEAINIRSGDTIIIQNIPPVLFDAIDNTFIVDETIADLETGIVRIIPEKPIAQLETLLSKVKL